MTKVFESDGSGARDRSGVGATDGRETIGTLGPAGSYSHRAALQTSDCIAFYETMLTSRRRSLPEKSMEAYSPSRTRSRARSSIRHEYIGSDGRGVTQYRRRGDELHFRIRLANLNADAVQIHVHGDGRADSSYLVRMYEPEDADVDAVVEGPPLDNRASGVTGTITDNVASAAGDVDTVAELVEELAAGRSVLNVHTEEPDGDGGGEIAGFVEARGQ